MLISGGLCVLRDPGKVDQHTALIADDPGVVTGRHIECITGAVLDFGTVVHLHHHTPFKDIAGVRGLARGRSSDRLNVFRPTPSRFEYTPAKGVCADGGEVRCTGEAG